MSDETADDLAAEINRATDERFWELTGYKPGQKLDRHDHADAQMIPQWLSIRYQIAQEYAAANGDPAMVAANEIVKVLTAPAVHMQRPHAPSAAMSASMDADVATRGESDIAAISIVRTLRDLARGHLASQSGNFVGVVLQKPPPAETEMQPFWLTFEFPTQQALVDWYNGWASSPTLYMYVAAIDRTQSNDPILEAGAGQKLIRMQTAAVSGEAPSLTKALERTIAAHETFWAGVAQRHPDSTLMRQWLALRWDPFYGNWIRLIGSSDELDADTIRLELEALDLIRKDAEQRGIPTPKQEAIVTAGAAAILPYLFTAAGAGALGYGAAYYSGAKKFEKIADELAPVAKPAAHVITTAEKVENIVDPILNKFGSLLSSKSPAKAAGTSGVLLGRGFHGGGFGHGPVRAPAFRGGYGGRWWYDDYPIVVDEVVIDDCAPDDGTVVQGNSLIQCGKMLAADPFNVAFNIDGAGMLTATLDVNGRRYTGRADVSQLLKEALGAARELHEYLHDTRTVSLMGAELTGHHHHHPEEQVRAAGAVLCGALLEQARRNKVAGWWHNLTNKVKSVAHEVTHPSELAKDVSHYALHPSQLITKAAEGLGAGAGLANVISHVADPLQDITENAQVQNAMAMMYGGPAGVAALHAAQSLDSGASIASTLKTMAPQIASAAAGAAGQVGGPQAAQLASSLVNAAAGNGSMQQVAQQALNDAAQAASNDPQVAQALGAAHDAVAHATTAYHVAQTVANAASGDAGAAKQVAQLADAAASGDPAAQAVAQLASKVTNVAQSNVAAAENAVSCVASDVQNAAAQVSGALLPLAMLGFGGLGYLGWRSHQDRNRMDGLEQTALEARAQEAANGPAGDPVPPPSAPIWPDRPSPTGSDRQVHAPFQFEVQRKALGAFRQRAKDLAARMKQSGHPDHRYQIFAYTLGDGKSFQGGEFINAADALPAALSTLIAENETTDYVVVFDLAAPQMSPIREGGRLLSQQWVSHPPGGAFVPHPMQVGPNTTAEALPASYGQQAAMHGGAPATVQGALPGLLGLGLTGLGLGYLGYRAYREHHPAAPAPTTVQGELDLRATAAAAAQANGARIVGVVIPRENPMQVRVFNSSDDADDWYGQWMAFPHAIEYIAYFDRSDSTFPGPLNEMVGEPTVAHHNRDRAVRAAGAILPFMLGFGAGAVGTGVAKTLYRDYRD